MLGSLARWLRLLGYDATYHRRMDDAALATRARRARRVLVTRDRALAQRRLTGRVALLRARTLRGQWLELARACALRPPASLALTRCAVCNARLRPLSRRAAQARVPRYVHATRRRFRICPDCRRVFWRATHLDGIARRLGELRRAARRAFGTGKGIRARRTLGKGRAPRSASALKPGSGRGRRARRWP